MMVAIASSNPGSISLKQEMVWVISHLSENFTLVLIWERKKIWAQVLVPRKCVVVLSSPLTSFYQWVQIWPKADHRTFPQSPWLLPCSPLSLYAPLWFWLGHPCQQQCNLLFLVWPSVPVQLKSRFSTFSDNLIKTVLNFQQLYLNRQDGKSGSTFLFLQQFQPVDTQPEVGPQFHVVWVLAAKHPDVCWLLTLKK